MTPDQYRREGAEAMREAALEACEDYAPERNVDFPTDPFIAQIAQVTHSMDRIRAIDVDEVLAKVEAVDPLIAAAITLRDALDGDERSNMHCLLLAACFGAERFDKMTASPITHDGAPKAMLHDLLTAIIDPNDPALDDLRACNQPTMTVTARPAPDAVARLVEAITPAPQPEGEPVTLTYTNWRGETAQRTFTPKRIWWGATDWHPEPQWLLTAFDAEKQADRDFALKDFGAGAGE